jgi:hypothetical protein
MDDAAAEPAAPIVRAYLRGQARGRGKNGTGRKGRYGPAGNDAPSTLQVKEVKTSNNKKKAKTEEAAADPGYEPVIEAAPMKAKKAKQSKKSKKCKAVL